MADDEATPSARKTELLEAAYEYAVRHGLADLSLRPLAESIGSSHRVLLYLFDSKDGLIRAILARARAAQRSLVDQASGDDGLVVTAERLWEWLAAPEHRPLMTLWAEGYSRSLIGDDGPWAGFARATVDDWLTVLAQAQPARRRRTAAALAERTLLLAVLRGALLDLLATGDVARTSTAVRLHLRSLAS